MTTSVIEIAGDKFEVDWILNEVSKGDFQVQLMNAGLPGESDILPYLSDRIKDIIIEEIENEYNIKAA
jgi:hypothetical protein